MNEEKINRTANSWMTDEDWFNLGKADAWEKKNKQPPEQDCQAASMYELGYCEGKIGLSPTETITKAVRNRSSS